MPNELTIPEQKQQELAQSNSHLANLAKAISIRLSEWRSMPASKIKNSVGEELAESCKDLVVQASRQGDAIKAVFNPVADAIHKAHLAVTGLRGKFLSISEHAERVGRGGFSEYETDRKQRIEAERLEKERLDRIAKEKERQEELAHMKSQAVPEELIAQRAAAPIITSTVNVDENRGKIAGMTTVDKWVGTVVDPKAFLHYIADIPGLWGLVKVHEGALNKLLTSSKGQGIPGVKVDKDDIARRTKQAG